jgi:hypothetical protein
MKIAPNQQPSMKDKILTAINSGQVKMRPKWQFITGTALLIGAILAGALVSLFLSSFIVFMLRQSGVWFAPNFGQRGLGIFFTSLPWVLLLVVVIFIALLEMLIRRYSFAYGRPVLYSILGVIILVLFGGVALGLSSFHQNLFDRAENGNMRFAAPFYRHFAEPPGNITVGTVTELTPTGCKIQGPNDAIFNIAVTAQTEIPPGDSLKIGDNIVVLGPRQGSDIQALGIRKPGDLPPPRHHFRAQFESQ